MSTEATTKTNILTTTETPKTREASTTINVPTATEAATTEETTTTGLTTTAAPTTAIEQPTTVATTAKNLQTTTEAPSTTTEKTTTESPTTNSTPATTGSMFTTTETLSTVSATTAAVTEDSSIVTESAVPIVFATTVSGAMELTTTEGHYINGTVMISIRIVFPNLKPVPSKSEVLSLASKLLDVPGKVQNKPVMVENMTYETLSDSTFAITQSFRITDVSMSEDTELRNETHNLIQDALNTLLTSILSKPGPNTIIVPLVNFTNFPNRIHARAEYVYQESDISKPSRFLQAILSSSALTTTAAPATTTSAAQTVSVTTISTTAEQRYINGTVTISIRIVFPNLKPVPSQSEVLSLASKLLDVPGKVQNNPVMVENMTYETLSDSAFAITQSFRITDVSMSEDTELRNETHNLIQDALNTLLHSILSKPGPNNLMVPHVNYTNFPDRIHARVEYVYEESDIRQPSKFLSAILPTSAPTVPPFQRTLPVTQSGPLSSTVAVLPTTLSVLVGSAMIYIRVVFHTTWPIPTETEILTLAKNLLDSYLKELKDPVEEHSVIFEKLSDNSFAINFTYRIPDVSMSSDFQVMDETSDKIHTTLNKLLKSLLCQPDASPFVFPKGNYTYNGTHILVNMEYVFREGDISQPSSFLSAILQASGLATTAAPPTTTNPVLLLVTGSVLDGSFPGWALAIIIPCGIVLILVPFWILLCCLLCGCCAAIKRRLRRRYRIQQYRTHPVNQQRIHPL